jgi:hypothetical protein
MRVFLKFMVYVVIFPVSLLAFSPLSASELIEPSRSLGGEQQPTTGRLTVLSEPPGLKITLDGDSLGKTPTFMVEVEEGIHTLRVKESETDIYVKPGETLKISLHKGEFILIPVKEKPAEEQPPTQVATEKPATGVTTSRDPIRQKVDRDRRQSQQRWQRFIDGSSPARIF